MARWLGALCGRDAWLCFGAFDADRLVGTGGAYVVGEHAWLGIAATLPQARGRGAQSAILAGRIDAAAAAGARTLAVETGDRVDGEAGPSFRNIQRAGFEEAYRQVWWQLP
jgi:GNAT superfamily N-acetyltransferase